MDSCAGTLALFNDGNFDANVFRALIQARQSVMPCHDSASDWECCLAAAVLHVSSPGACKAH